MAQLAFPVTLPGLAVPVLVGFDSQSTTAVLTAGRPIPAPVAARGLLDTGCDVTAVSGGVLQQLAIPPATTASTHTAGGSVAVRLYSVSVSITDPSQPSSPWLTIPQLLVMELTTVLPDTDVLIGLDILLTCRMLLDGPARWFTLDF